MPDLNLYNNSTCFHGGAFFEAIGVEFNNLKRKETIINADVLDAWFPPAPKIEKIIQKDLGWIMKTSPPIHAEGLIRTISSRRNIDRSSILIGSGSSDLIFRILPYWLNSSSKVLLLDPTYGEYSHILKNIIRCKVEYFNLRREEGYKLNTDNLAKKLNEEFDLFVWVNPNNPTGLHIKKDEMEILLTNTKGCKRIWIDETYIEYAGRDQSLERFAEKSENIFICKSMSKVYALSGLRAAYLCASPLNIEKLKSLIPPWSMSLPAQIAATFALQEEDYYIKKYQATHALRDNLYLKLKGLGINEVIPGVANFLTFHLPEGSKPTSLILAKCVKNNLYLRNISTMGVSVNNAIRMAVKDNTTNNKMLKIFENSIKS